MCDCVCVCVCACVRAYVRACVRAYVLCALPVCLCVCCVHANMRVCGWGGWAGSIGMGYGDVGVIVNDYVRV